MNCTRLVHEQDQPVIAVPNLNEYTPHSGIGRVLHSLCVSWKQRVQLVEAKLVTPHLPLLRNLPRGVQAPEQAQLILLPKLTGAQALRQTGGVPSIVIVHDVGIVDFPGDRAGMGWLSYQMVRQSFFGLRYASQIIAVSEFCKQRICAHLPELAGRISVIPNGVDWQFLNYTSSRQTAHQRLERLVGSTLGGPLLLYVGSELPRKNIPLLLRVFRQIKDRYPRAQLVKVGRAGSTYWRTQTLAIANRLGLLEGNDLIVLEDIDDTALADAYRAADLFVSTSLYEGFGLAALEAMAVGTPVVVSRCGAHPEVVGDAGLVVEPACEPFVAAITALLAEPSLDQLVCRCRARAARYTWSRAAEHYLALIHSLCDSHSSRAARAHAAHIPDGA